MFDVRRLSAPLDPGAPRKAGGQCDALDAASGWRLRVALEEAFSSAAQIMADEVLDWLVIFQDRRLIETLRQRRRRCRAPLHAHATRYGRVATSARNRTVIISDLAA